MMPNDNDNDISYIDVVTDDLVDGFDLIGENLANAEEADSNIRHHLNTLQEEHNELQSQYAQLQQQLQQQQLHFERERQALLQHSSYRLDVTDVSDLLYVGTMSVSQFADQWRQQPQVADTPNMFYWSQSHRLLVLKFI